MSALLAGAPVFVSSTKTAFITARAVEYVGTAVFYGGIAFVAGLWPAGARSAGARRLLTVSWIVGTLSTLVALGLEGAYAGLTTPGKAFTGHALRATLATDYGREWGVMALLWGLGLIVLADLLRRGEDAAGSLAWRVGATAVGLGTVRIFGLTSHAKYTVHPLLAQTADLVHLVAMGLWIGGLTMLLAGVLPGRNAEEMRRLIPRYSLLSKLCVGTVVITGTVLAWRVVGSFSGVTDTTYGHLLLVKIGLLAVIMAAAFGSKTWVEHRLDFAVILRADGAALVRPFVVSVATETALVLLVLTVASFLVTADPGR